MKQKFIYIKTAGMDFVGDKYVLARSIGETNFCTVGYTPHCAPRQRVAGLLRRMRATLRAEVQRYLESVRRGL